MCARQYSLLWTRATEAFEGPPLKGDTRDHIKQEGIVFGPASDPVVAEHAEQWAGEPVETGGQALALATSGLPRRLSQLRSTPGTWRRCSIFSVVGVALLLTGIGLVILARAVSDDRA